MRRDMVEEKRSDEWEALRSLKDLIRAGLDLGVPEAVRKSAQLAPFLDRITGTDPEAPSMKDAAMNFIESVKSDPQAMLQLAKEVWSRGGKKEKERAAEAVGKGLGYLIPHRALQAARDLASMARSGKEADMVGRVAIEPLMERSPGMLDRVKQLLDEHEKLIRYAALTSLVYYVGRKRKYAAMGAEVLLLLADEHEKEIRDAVKWGMNRIREVDPKATAVAVAAWVKQNPTTERIQSAGQYLKKRASDVKFAVENGIIGTLARLNGGARRNGSHSTPKKGAKRAAPRKRSTSKR